ncbi:MAG TPA: glycoside hydrolase family 2 TIM barrel-domain containing protein [Terriglobales bacterium]
MNTRRKFLQTASSIALGASLPQAASAAPEKTSARPTVDDQTQRISLNGTWQFRFDPDKTGERNGWYKPETPSDGWKEVQVPHTWQIAQDSAEYFGTAWYRRVIEPPPGWTDRAIRIEFEAVYHSATVWVNGKEAGKHLRKGYTAFEFDIGRFLRPGRDNVVVVMVNSDFDTRMLPRGHSSDWTNDGGIYRPASLLVSPQVYIERVDVDAVPDLQARSAQIDVSVVLRNTTQREVKVQLAVQAVEERTGLTALDERNAAAVSIGAGATITHTLPGFRLANPKLWHFDAPNLYSLAVRINGARVKHELTTIFGIRSFEVKDGSFWLNGERVRVMGVERMAGSNPNYGMAEPSSWIDHDHDDLKELNCIFTRVHWPQDKRVLDYCDRHGIFIQTEVPTWGPDTFKDMKDEPDPDIMENGLEQLREMIARDRNHPSICSWGLCNEINGQNPPAYKFAQRMYQEAKRLNPRRLRSYASNSLQHDPGDDVSKLMDFIEWNEYYESWYPGTPEDLRRNLEEIHRAFPDKPIVISEYGWCACTPDRPEGDSRRIAILRDHTRVCRETHYVGGLIFFCYNDYRTHIGDQGVGVLKQRIHGVVDLLGDRKPSYAVLRDESSPLESMECEGQPSSFVVTVKTRQSIPAYNLAGYKLRAILYGYSEIPLEQREAALPLLSPGQSASLELKFQESKPVRVEFEVIRPTGFAALTKAWKP